MAPRWSAMPASQRVWLCVDHAVEATGRQRMSVRISAPSTCVTVMRIAHAWLPTMLRTVMRSTPAVVPDAL